MACGEHYALALPAPIDVVVAASKAFDAQHYRCWSPAPSLPRCWACLKLGHDVEDHVRLHVHRAEDWPTCGDTGLSSKAIWRHMMGGSVHEASAPRDPDDFGRCHRLLAAPWANGWKARMGWMTRYPEWRRIALAWEELDALYVEERPTGNAPRLFARMRALEVRE